MQSLLKQATTLFACFTRTFLLLSHRSHLLYLTRAANIENLVNKSKKDWAYTMLDVTGNVDADAFKTIDGVVGVRVL